MHTRVYTKMSTGMPTKFEDFCATHHGVPTKTPTRVPTRNLTVLMKMYTKVFSVIFHLSYFHMFCFLRCCCFIFWVVSRFVPEKGRPLQFHYLTPTPPHAINSPQDRKNKYDLANWRSYSWTERFFFSAISHYVLSEKGALVRKPCTFSRF